MRKIINKSMGIVVVAAMILPLPAFAQESEQFSVTEEELTTTGEQAPGTADEKASGTGDKLAASGTGGDADFLPTITIEGRYDRPGAVALEPDTGGTLDTSSLLHRVPGGAVNRNGPLTGIASYRGMYGRSVNVMVDGMRLAEVGPNAMDTSLSYVPRSMVKLLKVYRGIAPVSSGIETIGGTVIAESRRSEFTESGDLEFHGFATGGYSWVNSGRYASMITSVANGNHRLHAAGTWERGRDYEAGGGVVVRPTRYERRSWSVGYGFQMNDQEFFADYDNKDTGWTGTPSLPMDIIGIRSDVVNMGYQGTVADNIDLEVRGFYQNATHDMNNFTLRPPPTPFGQPRFRAAHTALEAGGYKASATLHEILSGDLKFGVDGGLANHSANIKDPTNPRFFIDNFNDVSRNLYAGFAEWTGSLVEQWSLELGIRYNRVEMNAGDVATSIPAPPAQALAARFNAADRQKDNNNVDGVVVVRFAPIDSLDLELGFASKTRSPNYQERYLWIPLEATGGLADGRVYVGDINLAPERSYDAEFGIDWHGADFYVAPRLFYRYVDNYIQGLPVVDDPLVIMVARAIQPGGPGPLRFSNINAQFMGIDVETGYSFNDYLRIDSILSYVRGTRVGSISDNLYRISPLNGRLKLTGEYQDWMSYLEFVGAIAQDSVAAFNGELPSRGWGIANFRLQYQPHYDYLEGTTLAFGIENMFDKRYARHVNGINRASNSDVAVGQRVFDPGRNFYLTASFDW